ncbi:unnamed protein product [Brassica oleracea]
MDDGKDRAMFVVFDKEMTKLTKQEAVVLALEEMRSYQAALESLLGRSFFFKFVSHFSISPYLHWEGGLSRASSSEAVVAPKLGMGGDTATPPGIEEVEKTCKSRR